MSRMFLVPVGDVEVKDTWHVDGMAATGSRDIIARSVFVPARARVDRAAADLAPGPRRAIPASHPDAAVPRPHGGDPFPGMRSRDRSSCSRGA